MKEVTYELLEPFSYAKDGQPVEASFVTLKAPSYKQAKHATPIKQAFMKSMFKMTENMEIPEEKPDPVEDSIQSGEEVMQLMSAFYDDLTPIKIHAEELFKKGVALIDGEVVFTNPLLEKMSFDDFDNMLGTYVANFLAPSPKKKTPNAS